jgi:fructosamine-3-kinase
LNIKSRELKFISEIIEHELGVIPHKIIRLHAGDINQVYHCITKSNQLVIKVNIAGKFPNMFEKEKKGLKLLEQSNFKIPKILSIGSFRKLDYLVLEYIKPGKEINWKKFGENLANLHQISNDKFGLGYDNYIGSIHQINAYENNWLNFYTNHRIIQLMIMARNKNLLNSQDCKKIESICNSFKNIIPNTLPSLVHGDLWSGNLFFSENGLPVLIDPAVYFGHPEMDWAMLDLFGNYPEHSFEIYNEINPLLVGFKERKAIHQLYPLLVHLVLFGKTYYSSVMSKVKLYS